MGKRVLISGASVAGPWLALWLQRYGYDVTVVERVPQLREGGQAIDIRGAAKDALRRSGLDQAVRDACTNTGGMTYVDRNDRPQATMTADQLGGDGFIAEIEILRGDLSQVYYDATKEGVDYVFGERIAELSQDDDGVDVTFASGKTDRFDLVFGADGLHSATRAAIFGPEKDYVHHLGVYLSFYSTPNVLDIKDWWIGYTEPGRNAGVRTKWNNTKSVTMFGFKSPEIDYDYRDLEQQKQILREHVGDMQWHAKELLSYLDDADDFYFDACAQVVMDSWTKGRVALVGDAAYCPSPASGQGTSLAMVGGYILAGELAAADGDHERAFAEYNRKLRDYVEGNQKLGRQGARSFTAKTKRGIALQYLAIKAIGKIPFATKIMARVMAPINGIELPDYRHLEVTSTLNR